METNGMQSGILPGMLGLEMPLHPHHHQQPQQQHPNHQNHQYPPHLHQHMVTFASHDPEHHTQSVKPSAYTYPSKSKQPPAPAPPQQMTLSDEDEHGFAGDENGGDGRKRVSTWQRVKWTDNMVRILIMMVFYVGDDNLPEASNLDLSSACKKKAGGLLQKKGKWKSVSRAMMEKEFYVSPQQCEDKFNDLNKRYKRVNDILGKGTACKVVENQNLLESMDHLSPKMKDEARKLLNSKHLFFREMCAYHNSGSNGGGGGGVPHQSLEMAMESHNSQQQRCFHSPEAGATVASSRNRGDMEGLKLVKRGVHDEEDDDGEEDDEDEDDEDDYDDEDEEETRTRGKPNGKGQNCHSDDEDDDKISSKKRKRRANSISISPSMQQLSSELMNVLQDGTKTLWEQRQWMRNRTLQLEEQRVSYQCEAFELEKQRLKWVKFSGKKEREMERMKLNNERKRLQNDRMVLVLRQKELQFFDHHQQQNSSSKRTDPSCLS